MTFARTLAALAAFATAALLFTAPASAQATRTWVSGVGDDANPCSRTAPCKTFAGAFSKTAPAGEIDCLDPGGFGGVSITQSITIDCSAAGNIGGVLNAGTNGFNVLTGATQVQLIGLDINGDGTGLNGVQVGGNNINLSIINCLIYQFQAAGSGTGAAVLVTGTGDKVYVQNSIIRNNNAGVAVQPTSGSASVELDHVYIDNNSTTGAGNLSGSLVVGTGGVAILNASTLTSASPAVNNGGTVFSYGNNMIRGTITGTAITTQTLQ